MSIEAASLSSLANSITIRGGMVTATGSEGANGIGGGDTGRGSKQVEITGGMVTAAGGSANTPAIGATPSISGFSPQIYGNTSGNTEDYTVVTSPVWNTLYWVMIVKASGSTFTVTPPSFTANYGYSQPAAQTVRVSSGTIQGVSINDSTYFTLSGSGSSWSIQPNTGLGAGTYQATITVVCSFSDGYSSNTAQVTFMSSSVFSLF